MIKCHMFFYETARGGNNPGRQKAPSGGPSVRDSKMKKALSKILMFSVISGFALAFAAGCVSQTYKNGVPVADEDEDAVKSREAFKEISRVINSYKGEYADLHFEKTEKIMQEIADGDVDTIKEVMNDPDSYPPPVLMSYAVQVFRSGNYETAMFWYYTAQLRARSDANKSLDRTTHQGVTELSKVYGAEIGNFAKLNPEKLEITMNQVLEWDKTAVRKYNPKWVAVMGSEARVGTKIRFIPEDQYALADSETRRGWEQGFQAALRQLKDRQAERAE